MKVSSTSLYAASALCCALCASGSAVPTPAVAGPLAVRQDAASSAVASNGPGAFSIGNLDPSLSRALQSALSSASSYTGAHSTIPVTSATGSACPQGGSLVNGLCCPSGIVIGGKCYESTSTSTAPAQTTTTSGSTGNTDDAFSLHSSRSTLTGLTSVCGLAAAVWVLLV